MNNIVPGPWTVAQQLRNQANATYRAAQRTMSRTARDGAPVRIHPATGRMAARS